MINQKPQIGKKLGNNVQTKKALKQSFLVSERDTRIELAL